ncbi:MAG: triose-phosphate isomerase [Candidatus Berkiellales bacterium]
MATKLHVIGNWKMHGSKQHVAAFCTEIANAPSKHSSKHLAKVEVAICPPFVYLHQAAKLLAQIPAIKLGAQDLSRYESGAYTGQIAASMLVDIGCRYVIIGHSERRQYNHESNEEIAAKFFAAKSAGLIPILCVGETKEQRERNQTESIILEQIHAVLSQSQKGADCFNQALIAYEPVWAIGTGLTATPELAQAIHHLLRQTIAEYDANVAEQLPILYGGSVKASNATELFRMPDVDGALVGGASLQPTDFLAICEIAKNLAE